MQEFKKFEIVSSGINAANQHKFTVAEPGTGNLSDIRYFSCRAGIAWATESSPFYLCCVGQNFIDPDIYAITDPSYELLYELIDDQLDLESRHNAMADAADIYLCRFYADLSGIHEESAAEYRRFKNQAGFDHGSLIEAPHVSNIRMGVETLKSLVKADLFDIDEGSTAFDQLSLITAGDLAEPDVMQRFFSIEGLRHCMASFRRDRGTPKLQIRLPHYGYNQQGWML